MRPLIVMKPGKPGFTLCERLIEGGTEKANVHFWPVFNLLPPSDKEKTAKELVEAAAAGFLIVIVSPSCARIIASYLNKWPAGTKFASVGEPTAKVIKELWGPDTEVIFPKTSVAESGSEALYALIKDTELSDKVLIARGQTGREFLYENLVKDGKEVKKCVAYYRQVRKLTNEDKELLGKGVSPVIYLTTFDSVRILLEEVPEKYHQWLKSSVVCTIHSRIVEELRARGFTNVKLIERAENTVSILLECSNTQI